MHYDNIKRSLGVIFNTSPALRILFYKLLNLLLLRTWHIHNALNEWAENHGGKMKLLDAGAGFGQYSFYLSTLNSKWDILAVDVKQEQVDDCNQFFQKAGKKNVLFEMADLTQFKKDNTFDLILSVDVMEHIEEDVEVFNNFYASLKEGGMLLISTPSDQGGSDVHEHDESSFIDEHVRDGYSIHDIESKLKTAGFTNIQSKYSYGSPGKISWKLSMKYPILMLNISKLFLVLLPFYYAITFPVAYVLNYMDTTQKHSSGTGLIVKAWK